MRRQIDYLTDIVDYYYVKSVVDGEQLSKDQISQLTEVRDELTEMAGADDKWVLSCNEMLINIYKS